jgi:cell wall assembly regulator SMI1
MIQTGNPPDGMVDDLAVEFAGFAEPATAEQIQAAEGALGVVFPACYRSFLLRFGAGRLRWLDIFGIPRQRLWGDIVMMNQLAPVKIPAGCVLFARDLRGNFYYLERAQANAAEENPVIRVSLDGNEKQVASSFTEFLRDVARG